MQINGATALVTGANRGIGRHLTAELAARGATVYAAARRPQRSDLDTIRPLALDLTDPVSVAAAAQAASDVDLLINNAGINTGATLLGDLDQVHAEMDTNFWGTLAVVRAFAPVLGGNGGGVIVNIASGASWMAMPGAGAYAVSKAAVWNMSNALRWELAGQGTSVLSVHLGATDTDMGHGGTLDKNDPADVARTTVDAVERGDWEVVVDDQTRLVKQWLSKEPRDFYQLVKQMLGA